MLDGSEGSHKPKRIGAKVLGIKETAKMIAQTYRSTQKSNHKNEHETRLSGGSEEDEDD